MLMSGCFTKSVGGRFRNGCSDRAAQQPGVALPPADGATPPLEAIPDQQSTVRDTGAAAGVGIPGIPTGFVDGAITRYEFSNQLARHIFACSHLFA